MIKLSDLARFESIKNAQNNIGAYSNYLNDVLKPAIERGYWDVFENLDIGFTVTGKSLGKIGNNTYRESGMCEGFFIIIQSNSPVGLNDFWTIF